MNGQGPEQPRTASFWMFFEQIQQDSQPAAHRICVAGCGQAVRVTLQARAGAACAELVVFCAVAVACGYPPRQPPTNMLPGSVVFQFRRVDDAFPSTSGAMPGLEWWTGEAWSTLPLREEPRCEPIQSRTTAQPASADQVIHRPGLVFPALCPISVEDLVDKVSMNGRGPEKPRAASFWMFFEQIQQDSQPAAHRICAAGCGQAVRVTLQTRAGAACAELLNFCAGAGACGYPPPQLRGLPVP
ncbi:hypothetical protein D9M68_574220 [compost metagenome]